MHESPDSHETRARGRTVLVDVMAVEDHALTRQLVQRRRRCLRVVVRNVVMPLWPPGTSDVRSHRVTSGSYVWGMSVSANAGDLPTFRGPGRAHIIIRQEKEYVRFRWRGSHAAHVCGGVQEQQYHQLRQHHQRVTPRRARAHRSSSFGALRPILEIDYCICLSMQAEARCLTRGRILSPLSSQPLKAGTGR